MQMIEILSPDGVRAGVKVASKKRLLEELGELAAGLVDMDAAEIAAALSEREVLGSTAMGHGIAIPHARLAGLDGMVGLFLKLDRPIEFGSVDGRPVDLVFALLAPAEAAGTHLRALARVSRTLSNGHVCEKLRANDQPATLHAILTELTESRAA